MSPRTHSPFRAARRLLPALALAAAALLAPGCKNDLDRVRAIEVPAGGPDRITTGAEYFYSDSGTVRNRVRAGTVAEYDGDSPHTLLGGGVELTFYGADGQAGSRLTARRGRIDQKAKRMQVEEKVVFVNTKGEQLETEQLTWSQDSGRVSTDRPVKITRAHDVIYGQGLDAVQDFSRYTVRHITGTIFVDRSDTLAPTNQAP